jgi:di/tricarboxylate transporter
MYRPLFFFLPFLGLLGEFLFRLLFNEAMSNTSLVVFMALWMIMWWILGIAPLGITALIPLIYLPLMQILPLKSITPYYSDPMIFLFLGGFIIARGLEKTELSERIALNVLKVTGRSDGGIIMGFIVATAVLSMWISNTATAIMMIPIAQSVLKFLKENTNIILLFGGGMAMAGVMEEFGIIQSMVSLFDQVPATSPYLLVLLLAILTLLLTEVMSNVALCMIALPILMSLGEAKGIPPVWIGLPAAICASFAFSLPVSTPPNAIIFGTNKILMKDMLKAGIIMNILGVISVMSLGWVLMKVFLT